MAEYICYPERLLHKIPADMTWEQAAMVEPTANVVTDVLEKTGITPGDLVVVQGPGPIGLLAAMAARSAGARDVVILGTPGDEALRLKTARDLGFKHVINIGKDNPVSAIMDVSGGIGADVVVECSGAPKAIPGIVEFVRKLGRVCAMGLTGNRPVELPWDKFAFKVVELQFCMSTYYTSWDRSISLIYNGSIKAERLVTHKVGIDRWQEAFDAVEKLEALKALIIP